MSTDDYEKYSLSYISSLISALKSDAVTSQIPIILFAREPKKELTTLIDSGADCLSLYWNETDTDLNIFRGKVALQGNLNPKILLESNNLIKQETFKILDKYKDYPGYIFNLGHGITPDISPDKIRYLTDLVRSR